MGDSTYSCCIYCCKHEESWAAVLSFKCNGCRKFVHYDCIKSSQPSPLLSDVFFDFKCETCGEEKKEEFHRMAMSWQNVIMLTLYNLHKTGYGRCGFFHWRAHVCAFIDKNWLTIFGQNRKKTGLWMGTVAGTLSSGCPHIFESGTSLVEQGFWRLTNCEPPLTVHEKKTPKSQRKRQFEVSLDDVTFTERRTRQVKASPLSAAIELKKKRSTITETRRKKRQSQNQERVISSSPSTSPQTSNVVESSKTPIPECPLENMEVSSSEHSVPPPLELETQSSQTQKIQSTFEQNQDQIKIELDEDGVIDSHLGIVKKEIRDNSPFLGSLNSTAEFEDSEEDFDIDIGTAMESDMDFSTSLSVEELLRTDSFNQTAPYTSQKSLPGNTVEVIKDEPLSECESEGQSEKEIHEGDDDDFDEKIDCEVDNEDENTSDVDDMQSDKEGAKDESEISMTPQQKKKIGRPRLRRCSDDEQPSSPPPRLKQISVFEESELLQKLTSLANQKSLTHDLAQLRRKLLCNQTNREFGLPVFNLDAQAEKNKCHLQDVVSREKTDFFSEVFTKSVKSKETRDLDRFMITKSSKKLESQTHKTFYQRLVGIGDKDLKPVISPYTTRVLMPFIWRNYTITKTPLKMKLLQEIQAYPHRHDPNWKPPPVPPIDYCYIRPEHIPSVNALCREFFWPGIDMSECLQYPDFTCVVLYRKIVVAFAFMVPDRGYNEAYVSFIFTHPEWRGAGIATFMLYHLIQTCMGKDVLLHVSASNSAMLLYQKFGFKVQEVILNFYYKYFPHQSPDSTHAFLMRLTR